MHLQNMTVLSGAVIDLIFNVKLCLKIRNSNHNFILFEKQTTELPITFNMK